DLVVQRDRLEHCPQLVESVRSRADYSQIEIDLGVRSYAHRTQPTRCARAHRLGRRRLGARRALAAAVSAGTCASFIASQADRSPAAPAVTVGVRTRARSR